jgi:kynureninase
LPRLEGWWGSNPTTRFLMTGAFEPTPGAAGWQVSNPPILSAAPLFASLELFGEAGTARLRSKSRSLSAFLQAALQTACGDKIEVITPTDVEQRGAQLSIRVRGGSACARRAHAALGRRGVVGDWREPDTIRLAPVPLYNGFSDAWRAASELAAAIRDASASTT